MMFNKNSSFHLCYFAKYRNNFVEWCEIEENGIRENRLLFVENKDFNGERDREDVKHLPNNDSFQYQNYIIGDFVVYERKGYGHTYEQIHFNITKPYCSEKIGFVLVAVPFLNYSAIFKFLKFVLDYYINNSINIEKLTNECLSKDLYYLYNQVSDTFIKDLHISDFSTRGHLNTISISNFYDSYIMTVIENCIMAGYKTDYLNMNFSIMKSDDGRIVIYDTNEDVTFYKFKIILSLKEFYNIDNHLRYTLMKHGCF